MFNMVALEGWISRDLELKASRSGNVVLPFTLGVPPMGKSKESSFVRCIAYGRTAQIINDNFKKGSRIGVQGYLEMTVWTDASGQRRETLEVVADKVHFPMRIKGSQTNVDTPDAGVDASEDAKSFKIAEDEDGLPF